MPQYQSFGNSDKSPDNTSRREKSDVWKYFKKNGQKSVTCQICSRRLAYHGGTSNLREHLVRIHPKEFNPRQKSKPASLEQFLSRTTCSAIRGKRITELISEMVARDLRPAATVKGEGFQALLNFIEPGYKIPSDTHIANIVRQRYEATKNALTVKMKKEFAFTAFTSDIWTSCANDAYISLTGHFIDSAWNMTSCVLATNPFPGHHTAVNIVEKFKEITGVYNFQQAQLVALVHDQASNMRLSGEMIEDELDCESLSCAAHRLQLCIEDGLSVSSIERAVSAAKKTCWPF